MPDLTNFIGRPFVAVYDDEQDSNLWGIELDGQGRIENKDPNVGKPDEANLQGTVFIRPIFSELDTRLQFGVKDDVSYELTLTPTRYTISDPTFKTGQEGDFYPQVPEEFSLPDDPSADRVADGPEEQDDSTEKEE